MGKIEITQDIVRNLSTLMSKSDTSSMKHTQRLSLIAKAFGRETDAFMHALKGDKVETKPATPISVRNRPYHPIPAGPSIEDLGMRDVGKWKGLLAARSGICVIVGPTQSGKTELVGASGRFLVSIGRSLLDDPGPTNAHPGSNVAVVGFELRDPMSAKRAFAAAQRGANVVAVMHGSGPADVYTRISDFGLSPALLHLVKGIATTSLVRKKCRACGAIPSDGHCATCGGIGYSGRTLVSSVVDTSDFSSPLHVATETSDGLVVELAALIRAGTTDLEEVKRVMGPVGLAKIQLITGM